MEARPEPVNINDCKGKTLLQVREECWNQNEVGRKQSVWLSEMLNKELTQVNFSLE